MRFFGGRIWMVMAEPKRTVRERVRRCRDEGLCLVCADAAEKVSSVRRGLCQRHYSQWYGQKRGMSDEQAAQYEAESIRDGKLLPARQGQRLDRANPYTEIAERVTGVV